MTGFIEDQLTKGQRDRLRIVQRYFPAGVDIEGTRQIRRIPECRRMVQITADLPHEVRTWVLDHEGDVVLEGGAEPA